MPPPGAQPKKSGGKWWVWVLLGCLVVCLVCGGGGGIFGYKIYQQEERESRATSEYWMEFSDLETRVEEYCTRMGANPPPTFAPVPPTPGETAQMGNFTMDPTFAAIGFAPFGPVYFSYSIEVDPMMPGGIILVAAGDMDGDGERSRMIKRCPPAPSCYCTEDYTPSEQRAE
jgi:hypothetical protein